MPGWAWKEGQNPIGSPGQSEVPYAVLRSLVASSQTQRGTLSWLGVSQHSQGGPGPMGGGHESGD